MNSLTNKLSFFILIILFFGFFSCQDKTKELGLSLPNQENVEVFFTDTMTIETSTVFIDSVNTTNSTSLLVGKLNDPQLGVMTASSVFTLKSDQQTVTKVNFVALRDIIKPNPMDPALFNQISIDLLLRYERDYGSNTASQTIFVHGITDNLSTTGFYTNKSDVAYNPLVLGSKVTNISTDLVRQNLVIPIGEITFKRNCIDLLGGITTDSLSQDNLNSILKGIYLRTDPTTSGAVLSFDATVSALQIRHTAADGKESFLTIPTRQPNASGSTNKRASAVRFNKIDVVRTGTPLTTLTPSSPISSAISVDNACTIQSAMGIYTKLTLPYLNKLVEQRNISINRADLVLYPIENSFTSNFLLPNSLELLELDKNSKRSKFIGTQIINGASITDTIIRTLQREEQSPFGISFPNFLRFSSIGGYYSTNVTTYIQYMINDFNTSYSGNAKKENNGFLIGVAQSTSPLRPSSTISPVNLDRLILRGAKAPTKSLKLRVFYTKNK